MTTEPETESVHKKRTEMLNQAKMFAQPSSLPQLTDVSKLPGDQRGHFKGSNANFIMLGLVLHSLCFEC